MIPTTDIVAKGALTGWRDVPFWSLFRRKKQTGFPEEELLSVYRDYGVIPKSSRDDNHNKESEDLSGYQLVTEGALVTNKMKAWQGSIAISRYRGIVSPAYYVYTPQSDEWDQFLHYLLRSAPYIGLYRRISKGVRVNQWDLEHEALRNIPVFLPDLPTQRAIADFLDRETTRIDSLIEKKQRLMELLGEKRSAVITSAVTGRHPRFSSDSGVRYRRSAEGGGGVKLKQGCSIYSDYGLNISAEEYTEKGVPLIRTSDVDDSGVLDLSNTKYVENRIVGTKFLEKGDVLFSRSGTIGRAMVFNAECEATYAAYLVRFRPHPDHLVSEYIKYWAQCADYWDQIGSDTIQSTIGNFNANKFANLSIPDHDLPTQRAIADFLDRETARVSKVTERTRLSIDRLKEYRSALITSAVTGQIDVSTYTRYGTTDRQLDAIHSEIQA